MGSKFAALLMPSLDKTFEATATIQSYVLMAQTAIELRRHKTEHGAYPEADEYEMPICPYDGKPIRYERIDGGFRLWNSMDAKWGINQWTWEQ